MEHHKRFQTLPELHAPDDDDDRPPTIGANIRLYRAPPPPSHTSPVASSPTNSPSPLPVPVLPTTGPMAADIDHDIDMNLDLEVDERRAAEAGMDIIGPETPSDLSAALLSKHHCRRSAWVDDYVSEDESEPDEDLDLESDIGADIRARIDAAMNAMPVPGHADDYGEFDWDFDNFMGGKTGLNTVDQLGVEFEREAVELGTCFIRWIFWPYSQTLTEKLTQYEIAICRAYAFKIREHVSDKGWGDLRHLYRHDEERLPSLIASRRRIYSLAAIKPRILDCCPNSCLCYVGPHADKDKCSFCQEPRYRQDGKPRKRFTYIPLIPRLRALFANKEFGTKLLNRSNRDRENSEEARKGVSGMKNRDIFDGTHYHDLKNRNIKILDETLSDKYFSDPHDIALGVCTDGVGPFKTRRITCWPLLVVNYNLPADLMFLLEYIMALGVIPGPNKPKDFDSFFWPFLEEMLQLMNGLQTYDALSEEYFRLRAFLLLVFGDIPAVSMIMQMKGHNGMCPCRMCSIIGLRIPGSDASTYYVPHDRQRYPHTSSTEIQDYDPAALPLRTHDEFKDQAIQVQGARTKKERETLGKKYGIKGLSVLFLLDTISFPASFPYDWMHLILENLIPNLVLFWTGTFKNLGAGEYTLADGIWAAIGRETAQSKRHIPSAYGPALPDFAGDGVRITADMYSFWTLYLGPVLLRRRFQNQAYYNHFIDLVALLHLCLKFEITRDDIQTIREGFVKWVKDYERYEYSDTFFTFARSLVPQIILSVRSSTSSCLPADNPRSPSYC
jgi:hypothetical protein